MRGESVVGGDGEDGIAVATGGIAYFEGFEVGEAESVGVFDVHFGGEGSVWGEWGFEVGWGGCGKVRVCESVLRWWVHFGVGIGCC